MELPVLILSVVMSGGVALGAYLTARGYRAYRQTRDTAMRWLTFALGLLTLGAVAEGIAFNILGWSLAWAQVLGASSLVAALAFMVVSLRPSRRSSWMGK